MPKRYLVELTPEERANLGRLVSTGKAAVRKIHHAQILLKADSSPGGPAWPDASIAEAFGVNVRTVERIRQRLVEHGLDDALERRQPRRAPRRKIDGEVEARLIALACGPPPQGRVRWTLRLLADQLVELCVVEAVGAETVRRALKKTNCALG